MNKPIYIYIYINSRDSSVAVASGVLSTKEVSTEDKASTESSASDAWRMQGRLRDAETAVQEVSPRSISYSVEPSVPQNHPKDEIG